MSTRPADIPFLSSLSFMLTYRCSNSCPHCIVEAGPTRKKKMALGSVLGWIDDAAAYRRNKIRSISLTGGEPFYDLQTLALISDHACNAGLSVSVETNAAWAPTLEQALSTLQELPAIRTIIISSDVYHQQFVPIENIHNAVIAAELLGLNYHIAVTTDNEKEEAYCSFRECLERIVDPARISIAVTLPTGRARKLVRRLRQQTSPEPDTSACMRASTPVIFPDGRVMACMGSMPTHPASDPLCLGNLRKESLESVLERAETNPMLHLLRLWGPHRMVTILKSRGHGDILPKRYIRGCHCDICTKLLSEKQIAGRIAEILDEPKTRADIAFARLYGLNEPEMAERFHIAPPGQPDPSENRLGPET